MTIKELNTFERMGGILLSPDTLANAPYILKVTTIDRKPVRYDLEHYESGVLIASFQSLAAAKYRALSDYIESQTVNSDDRAITRVTTKQINKDIDRWNIRRNERKALHKRMLAAIPTDISADEYKRRMKQVGDAVYGAGQ